jgi:hypothetical protein
VKPNQLFLSHFSIEISERGKNGYLEIYDPRINLEIDFLEKLQFFGEYALYNSNNITPIITKEKKGILVAEKQVGNGKLIIYGYDVAENIILLRQGNRFLLKNDREIDRANFLFEGLIDKGKECIPQADIHLKLFGNIVLLASKTILPRLWYFPDDNDALLLLTGDGEFTSIETYKRQLHIILKHRGTITYFLMNDSPINRRFYKKYLNRGIDFSIHPDAVTVKKDYKKEFIDHFYDFRARYGKYPLTVRNHRVFHFGYVEPAKLWAKFGIKMNFNYMIADGNYLTSSGLPMRGIDEDGNILNIYSQLTQITDKRVMYSNKTLNERCRVTIQRLMDAKNYFNTVVTLLMHPAHIDTTREWLEYTLQFCNQQNITIVNARQWCEFWESRENCRIYDVILERERLTFKIRSRKKVEKVTIMIPFLGVKNAIKTIKNNCLSSFRYLVKCREGISYLLIIQDYMENDVEYCYEIVFDASPKFKVNN